MPKIRQGKISDLTPDPKNANRGTERGRHLLETSLSQLGAGRSIVADANGIILAGNKTYAAFGGELGLEDTIEIETDGTQLVVVKRTDLDLTAPKKSEKYQKAQKLAIADNQVGRVSLDFDPVVLDGISKEVDLSEYFLDYELEGFSQQDLEIPESNKPLEPEDIESELNCECPKCGFKWKSDKGR
jgi:hypothetical protein